MRASCDVDEQRAQHMIALTFYAITAYAAIEATSPTCGCRPGRH